MLSKDNAGMISLLWCDAGDCQLVKTSPTMTVRHLLPSFLSLFSGKDSARRAQSKRKIEGFSFCSAELPPILWKDSARRAQSKRKIESFSFCSAEPLPILWK